MRFWRWLGLLVLAVIGQPAAAAFLGHGGPVKNLALSADSERMVSVSFDYSVIVWRLADGAALAVLHEHEAAVNTVAMLPDGSGFVTAGDAGRVLVWRFGAEAPLRRLEGHAGRVVDLAVSPDGRTIASASWDQTVRLWDAASGRQLRRFIGHDGPVSGVRFMPDGERLVSIGVDGGLRVWRRSDGELLARLGGGPSSVHGLALDSAGRMAYAAASDGEVKRFDLVARTVLPALRASLPTPLFALALSPDDQTLAATGLDGSISLWDTADGALRDVLAGDRSPLWSLAFAPDGRTLFAGGDDRTIRQWALATGAEIDAPAPLPPAEASAVRAGAAAAADEGAQVWRRCVACHTLRPDGGNRAGPTLHGIFGRRIGTVEGYPYSPALAEGDLVWTEETVGRLFTLGPDVVTPGTKMPVQRITDPTELAALLAFLRREGMPGG